METIAIIVAFWLILVGIYGALPLLKQVQVPHPAAPRVAVRTFGRMDVAPIAEQYFERVARLDQAQEKKAEPIVQPRPPVKTQPKATVPATGLFSEVDMLRAQVEHLRSELSALSTSSPREERSRSRRYRPGAYTELPRPLRRQVREVRSGRRHFSV